MILVQLTGLSGAGKTTLANNVKRRLEKRGLRVEIIDGDDYRKTICKDLGFSKQDRHENIRRLGFIGIRFVKHEIIVLLSAINPYEEIRAELRRDFENVKTVWLDCNFDELRLRDTKGLYKRALLSDDHPDKIHNLTGINDPYEIPVDYDLRIKTDEEGEDESTEKLFRFILSNIMLTNGE